MKDMKAALGNSTKPDHSHARTAIKTYIARACEYGSDKYQRANYMRPIGDNTPADNFERLRGYLRSVDTHVSKALDSMEKHLALDPELQDVEGMLVAAYAADTDPGNEFVGPSNLPHISHASAALMMAIVQATMYGILPEDPGKTWEQLTLPLDASGSIETFRCPHDVEEDYYCGSCQNRVRRPPEGTQVATKKQAAT